MTPFTRLLKRPERLDEQSREKSTEFPQKQERPAGLIRTHSTNGQFNDAFEIPHLALTGGDEGWGLLHLNAFLRQGVLKGPLEHPPSIPLLIGQVF